MWRYKIAFTFLKVNFFNVTNQKFKQQALNIHRRKSPKNYFLDDLFSF